MHSAPSSAPYALLRCPESTLGEPRCFFGKWVCLRYPRKMVLRWRCDLGTKIFQLTIFCVQCSISVWQWTASCNAWPVSSARRDHPHQLLHLIRFKLIGGAPSSVWLHRPASTVHSPRILPRCGTSSRNNLLWTSFILTYVQKWKAAPAMAMNMKILPAHTSNFFCPFSHFPQNSSSQGTHDTQLCVHICNLPTVCAEHYIVRDIKKATRMLYNPLLQRNSWFNWHGF